MNTTTMKEHERKNKSNGHDDHTHRLIASLIVGIWNQRQECVGMCRLGMCRLHLPIPSLLHCGASVCSCCKSQGSHGTAGHTVSCFQLDCAMGMPRDPTVQHGHDFFETSFCTGSLGVADSNMWDHPLHVGEMVVIWNGFDSLWP